jgi:hypothetical protein
MLLSNLSLERDGRKLQIRVAAPAIEVDPNEQAIAAAAPMRMALKELLDSHPLTRQVMRHLGYLERALATRGLKAMTEVPVEVLVVSLKQLESIVANWSDVHLADLRSRMAVAVLHRSGERLYGENGEQLSNFNSDSRLVVGDVSHSMFMELERQYHGLVSQEHIDASLGTSRTGS